MRTDNPVDDSTGTTIDSSPFAPIRQNKDAVKKLASERDTDVGAVARLLLALALDQPERISQSDAQTFIALSDREKNDAEEW